MLRKVFNAVTGTSEETPVIVQPQVYIYPSTSHPHAHVHYHSYQDVYYVPDVEKYIGGSKLDKLPEKSSKKESSKKKKNNNQQKKSDCNSNVIIEEVDEKEFVNLQTKTSANCATTIITEVEEVLVSKISNPETQTNTESAKENIDGSKKIKKGKKSEEEKKKLEEERKRVEEEKKQLEDEKKRIEDEKKRLEDEKKRTEKKKKEKKDEKKEQNTTEVPKVVEELTDKVAKREFEKVSWSRKDFRAYMQKMQEEEAKENEKAQQLDQISSSAPNPTTQMDIETTSGNQVTTVPEKDNEIERMQMEYEQKMKEAENIKKMIEERLKKKITN